MQSMTKQRQRENGNIMSVVKARATVCPYMKFAEGTAMKRFTTSRGGSSQ